MTTPDLQTCASVIELARNVVGRGIRHLAASGGPDTHQVLAYDLAHAAAAVETARSMLDYGAKGDAEGLLTCAFTADMVHDLITRTAGREMAWGLDPAPFAAVNDFLTTYRDPQFLASLAEVSDRAISPLNTRWSRTRSGPLEPM